MSTSIPLKVNESMVRLKPAVVALCAMLALGACSGLRLVAPYDEGLVNGVSAFQESASVMLQELEVKGPDGDYATFEPKYLELNASCEALLTRAVANAESVDSTGLSIADILNEAINGVIAAKETPPEGMSLSAANVYDLCSLVSQWQASHKAAGSQSSGVWTVRRAQLADAALAIITFEQSKAPAE